jgi:hypothetical protein
MATDSPGVLTTIRTLQVRPLLIPLAVATALVVALASYRLFWIPRQEQYLNERNSRILLTIGRQIAAKVDNFDQSIDNAIDFWWSTGNQNAKPDELRPGFPSYVKLFAPEVEVLDRGDTVVDFPDDPPRVRIQRDEGTNYLHMGYKHHKNGDGPAIDVTVEIKSDIEQVLKPYLESRTEFESLVLADHDGRAIAQYSSGGLRLEHLDRLDLSAAVPSSPKSDKSAYEAVKDSGKVASVAIDEVAYKFYAQPVVLSLMRDAKDPQTEEWTLCGLVRSDRFGAESLTIPPDYLLLFVGALLAICLSVPILKVHVLKPRERFHRGDAVWVAATTFLLAGFITVTVFDTYYFAYRFKDQTDTQLKGVAESLTSNLRAETAAALGQVESLRADLKRERGNAATWLRGVKPLSEKPDFSLTDDTLDCKPKFVCRRSLLSEDLASDHSDLEYPFFDLVTWTDKEGNQLVKWTTSKGITPFINLRSQKVPYFQALERANFLTGSGQAPVKTGIEVFRSPNTGNNVTVLWEALGRDPHDQITGVSMASAGPLTFMKSVLPRAVQFAVFDEKGQVVYHSDPTRSLNENFLKETQDNAQLRVAIQGRQAVPLTAQYLGIRHRMFVMPLGLPPVISDPRWSLAVFQPVEVPDTVNLEALIMTGAMFAWYCVTLAIAGAVAVVVAPARAKKWFWPDHTKIAAYRTAALVNLGLSATFLLVFARRSPPTIVVGAIGLALAGVAATFAVVTRETTSRATSRNWQRDFFLARLSFLVIAAAVPAMAFFQAAFTIETGVLVRRGDLHLERAHIARTDRIRNDAEKICETSANAEKCVRRFTSFAESYEIDDTPFFESTPAHSVDGKTSVALEAGWLDRILSFTHVRFNNEAVNVETAFLDTRGSESRWSSVDSGLVALKTSDGVITSRLPRIPTDPAYWIVAAVVVAGLALLLGIGTMKIFLLDLYVRPGFKKWGVTRTDGNLALEGAAGSRMSAMPRSGSASRVLDAPTDRFVTAVAGAHALVGIDHFEHRWIAATRGFLEHARGRALVDLARWNAALQSFRKRRVELAPIVNLRPVGVPMVHHGVPTNGALRALVLDECSMSGRLLEIGMEVLSECPDDATAQDVLMEIGMAAEPYYRALWATCSRDEQLALRQLAEEEVVNPRNGPIIERLLGNGVVRRDPTFRPMNETFSRFVKRTVPADEATKWEREGVEMPWSSYATSIGTFAIVAVAVLFLTQHQLLDAWIGYVPVLVPAATPLVRLLGAQPPAKSGAGNA